MANLTPLMSRSLPTECFIFKHSTACPVSSRALIEVRAKDVSIPIYQVNVLEQRELSDWVAKKFNIVHESPQLILVRNGKAKKVWNHWEIKQKAVTE